MRDSNIIVTTIGSRKIVIKGIGKMFYQNGFPIPIAIQQANDRGYEVSILHVADECLRNGWSGDTVIKKFREDFADSGLTTDMDTLKKFVFSDYEDQRQMIFDYLFRSENDARAFMKGFLNKNR
jgi:hypothetical protein